MKTHCSQGLLQLIIVVPQALNVIRQLISLLEKQKPLGWGTSLGLCYLPRVFRCFLVGFEELWGFQNIPRWRVAWLALNKMLSAIFCSSYKPHLQGVPKWKRFKPRPTTSRRLGQSDKINGTLKYTSKYRNFEPH